jgi:hypothetical protein
VYFWRVGRALNGGLVTASRTGGPKCRAEPSNSYGFTVRAVRTSFGELDKWLVLWEKKNLNFCHRQMLAASVGTARG